MTIMDNSQLHSQLHSLISSAFHRKQLRAILGVVIVICIIGILSFTDLPSRRTSTTTTSSKETSSHGRPLQNTHYSHLDHDELDAYTERHEKVTPSYTAFLEARQSKNLKQAISAYKLKYDRDPPPHFDKFVQFALNHKCLIDEYDQIHRDIAPFRKMNSTVFKRRVKTLLKDDAMSTYSVKNGRVEIIQTTYLNDAWDPFISKLAPELPDVDIIMNALDEPRVLLNVYDSTALSHVNNTDPSPVFHHLERSQHHEHVHSFCTVPSSEPLPTEAEEDYNAVHGLLIAPASFSYTHDLYPVLSPTKIHPCFSDIIVPPVYYSVVSPTLSDNVPWEKKESKLFWRGSTSGGYAVNGNWRQMHRQRFMLIARNRSDTDVGFTNIIQCDAQDCDSQRKEFSVLSSEPWEEHIKHKWLFDTDGNSFSGRFTRLLRSKSLIFKATIMTEYFSDWIKPYIHYVPISLSYDDLDAKLKWAAMNDELAKSIAEEGSRMSTRYLRPQDMECYTLYLLIELAALQHQPDQ